MAARTRNRAAKAPSVAKPTTAWCNECVAPQIFPKEGCNRCGRAGRLSSSRSTRLPAAQKERQFDVIEGQIERSVIGDGRNLSQDRRSYEKLAGKFGQKAQRAAEKARDAKSGERKLLHRRRFDLYNDAAADLQDRKRQLQGPSDNDSV
jgi:hypothetical protein